MGNQNSEQTLVSESLFENQEWLSTKDAAVYMRIFKRSDGSPSEAAIRTAIWRKQILAKKFRGKLFIKKAHLSRLIQSSKNVGGF